MADFDNSLSLSSLLCQEDDASCFNENNSFQELNFESSSSSSSSCFVLENEEIEYIEKMVEMESRSFTCSDDSSFANYSWLRCARLDAIDWIFNTRAIFGFRFHTAYLSVTYFDRFLSKRSIDDGKLWAIRLLSVACLSLAAKMEECRVPPLSEQKETVSRAGELIVAVIKEINLLDHRPSIIAMAAVLAASDNQLTRQELELKMKEIEMGKLKTPKQVISPNSSSIHSTSMALLENSSSTTFGAGTKRRLTYNDCDQNCPVKKICHQP
ncbi:cyclin d, putative [Ricinus communis]|uniref:B-like cyclin n=1 Tax=Ricinus communis TaxID=3988 RepID=B9SGZ7_RICCO|nr:cyclin d, putative [Ricinus communis]